MTWWGSGALVLGAALLSGARAGPRRHEVEIRGMAFHPAVLEVSRHRGELRYVCTQHPTMKGTLITR